MPKRRKKKNSQQDVARSPLTTLTPLPRPKISKALTEVEDRRQWHPERADRPALNIFGRPHRIVASKVVHRSKAARTAQRTSKYPTHRVSFKAPQNVLVCVRRQQRKEVLHAKGKTGSRTRKPRRTWRSDISCR